MKKLPAFTLLELLIGMIISSIVIGFGYAGYELIYKRYLSYNSTKKDIIDAIQLNTVINNDLITAESAQFETDKLILNYKNGYQKAYSFSEKYIYRTERELTDTFKVAVSNVRANENASSELAGMPITELSFDALLHEEKIHFHFTKNYSAETMINLELTQWPQ